MGIVSPLGNSVDAFRQGLQAGTDGIGPLTRFDAADFPFRQAGEVGEVPLPGGAPVDPAACDPATRFMLNAADQALRDAGLPSGEPDFRAGLVLSTNFGEAVTAERLFAAVLEGGDMPPDTMRHCTFQATADALAACWQWYGPRTVLSLSCASSTAAIGYAADLLRQGSAERVLTGGYDALSRFCWSGLGALRTMTANRIRPFDANRDGTIFSEGAGAFVLEELGAARRRGAPLYAEVLGYAANNNAYHMTAPAKEGRGSAEVMRAALDAAGCAPERVDHINMHGTGTRHNDSTETQAVKTVFGAHARAMPLTSIKAMTGHLMGAAGVAEALAAVLSIRHGFIPPVINYEQPDPACDLDYVVREARPAAVNVALSNSAGIGGCNAAVVLGAIA